MPAAKSGSPLVCYIEGGDPRSFETLDDVAQSLIRRGIYGPFKSRADGAAYFDDEGVKQRLYLFWEHGGGGKSALTKEQWEEFVILMGTTTKLTRDQLVFIVQNMLAGAVECVTPVNESEVRDGLNQGGLSSHRPMTDYERGVLAHVCATLAQLIRQCTRKHIDVCDAAPEFEEVFLLYIKSLWNHNGKYALTTPRPDVRAYAAQWVEEHLGSWVKRR